MSLVRGALVVGVAAVLTSWLVASGRVPPAAPASRDVSSPPMSGPASAPRSQTAQLRARLAAMPDTRAGSRDPFRFAGTPRTAPRAATPSEPAPIETAGETPDIAARPPLQLIGIGEDQGDGQPARTAIIAGMNQVFLVREGERLALRFQVKRIGADAVELDDLAAGETFRIALR